MAKTLRLILGDQLNEQHSWFQEVNESHIYCLFEMRQETDYVTHHIQKLAGFFTAMRNFSQTLKEAGHHVIYYNINDASNKHTISENLAQLVEQYQMEEFQYLLPDEWRVDEQLRQFCESLTIPYRAFDTEHFMSTRMQVKELFEGKKQILMETFYRQIRKQFGILMDGAEPIGGKWNYDAENRKKWNGTPAAPAYDIVKNDVSEVTAEIKNSGIKYIGSIQPEAFLWPVSRKQSLQLLQYFVAHHLPYFGTYQDAMSVQEPFLFHSRLSFALNTKMLSPAEVVHTAIEAWRKNPENISLPQIEGFVRQIIGWREYMRGIYWWKMPAYETLNFFNHSTQLPGYFWNGETKMNCVKQAVHNSLENAYAHHIQRLMVTGNFALLAGIHPDEVDKWYLGIYIDALQWVEITNTRGMSQFADGGIVGSKPYISSANYIDKMGDYCKGCYYDKKKKHGDKACPFNSLYWHFYERNRNLLSNNQRISMMYQVLNKMASAEKQEILKQAEDYLQTLETL